MIKGLIGLALGGLQTAAFARKFKRFGLAMGIAVVALIALQAAFVLAGWAMYLGFTYILLPAWAAAAATGVMIVLTLLLLTLAYQVLSRSPPDPIRQTMAQLPPLGRELARQHPAGALVGAAALGAVVALLLRR